MKKILIDLERLRYRNSGIANVFRNLNLGLEESVNDFEISYYSNKKDFVAQNIGGHQVHWNKLQKFFETFSKGYDLVHVSHQLSSYFHKNYIKTLKVVTLHDLNFLHENLSQQKRAKMLRMVQRNLKYADYIVCISEYAKEDLLKNKELFQFKKLKNIEVIHNGIILPEMRKYQLGRYNFLAKKKYILNIGVLFEKKNQLSLIEMLPFTNDDLVLIASDEKQPYANEVRNRILELNLEERVHFLRNVSEEEKYAIIQNCSSMCHPSIAEGFGIPPIEAMSFGKPVFLSKFTSLPEVGGEYAYYFEDFSPQSMAKYYIERMRFYEENKEILVTNIKKWTLQYSYKEMSNKYLDFYKRVLSIV